MRPTNSLHPALNNSAGRPSGPAAFFVFKTHNSDFDLLLDKTMILKYDGNIAQRDLIPLLKEKLFRAYGWFKEEF